MTRTVEVTIYQFDELTESGKSAALDWARGVQQSGDWWDAVYYDANAIAALMGIEIDRNESGACVEPAIYFDRLFCQGQGAGFDGHYAYKRGAARAVREYAPQDARLHRIADALQAAQRPAFYGLEARVRCVSRGFTSVDAEISDPRDIATGDALDSLTGALRDFADWIADRLADESLAMSEDAAIAEMIRANDWEFTADGAPA